MSGILRQATSWEGSCMEAEVVSGGFDEIAVVVRHTNYDTADPDKRISLMSAFHDVAKADEEARRLNAIGRDDRVTYFVKIAKLVPDVATKPTA